MPGPPVIPAEKKSRVIRAGFRISAVQAGAAGDGEASFSEEVETDSGTDDGQTRDR